MLMCPYVQSVDVEKHILAVNVFSSTFFFTVKGRLFDVKEFFLEDILKLTGFKKKELMKHNAEAHEGMSFCQWVPKCSLQFSLVFICAHSKIWFSAKNKPKSLTEWCEQLKNTSVEEEEGTSVLSRVPEDSSGLDGEDGALNSLVE